MPLMAKVIRGKTCDSCTFKEEDKLIAFCLEPETILVKLCMDCALMIEDIIMDNKGEGEYFNYYQRAREIWKRGVSDMYAEFPETTGGE